MEILTMNTFGVTHLPETVQKLNNRVLSVQKWEEIRCTKQTRFVLSWDWNHYKWWFNPHRNIIIPSYSYINLPFILIFMPQSYYNIRPCTKQKSLWRHGAHSYNAILFSCCTGSVEVFMDALYHYRLYSDINIISSPGGGVGVPYVGI